MITKLDNLLLKICKFLVLRRVKKSKHKQHKYHVEYSWEQMELILLLCAMMFDVVRDISHGHTSSGIFGFVIWLPVIFIKVKSLLALKDLAETYDWIWLNRKNPDVYNAVKELCDDMWKLEEHRRKKALKLYIGCTAFITFLLILPFDFTTLWLFFSYPVHILGMYNRYVFDLDPPEEKRKEESDSKLTSLMQKQLDKLFGDFAPKPI